MPGNQIIWMVGHSNHPIAKFLSLLTSNNLALLTDVRTSPRSRSPQFNREALKRSLGSVGIEYVHDARLGGRDPLPEERLAEILPEYLEMAARARCVMMCAEGKFRECHRHYSLVSPIRKLGWTVMQILPDGDVVEDLGPLN